MGKKGSMGDDDKENEMCVAWPTLSNVLDELLLGIYEFKRYLYNVMLFVCIST